MSREVRFRIANVAIAALIPAAAMLLTDMKVYGYSIFEEYVILSSIPFFILVFYVPSKTAVLLLIIAMRIASVLLLVRGDFTSTRGIVIKTAINTASSFSIALIGLFFMVIAIQ